MAKKTIKKIIEKAEKKVVKEPVKIKKKIIEPLESIESEVKRKTEKEVLLDLYNVLKARKINSISDLENLIANSK